MYDGCLLAGVICACYYFNEKYPICQEKFFQSTLIENTNKEQFIRSMAHLGKIFIKLEKSITNKKSKLELTELFDYKVHIIRQLINI